MNDFYDIEETFARIESELISSMSRNLDKHIREEIEAGINYPMWQSEQLLSLREFSKENLDKYSPVFLEVNSKIEDFINKSYTDESEKVRKELLHNKSNNIQILAFNKLNENKLKALINSTMVEFKKAESAMLRMVDDQYRRIIFSSQVYLNSGAGTLREAIDMATKDFLSSGIACVEYSNGARVGISSYSNMALRTADTRASLIGAAKSRDERGLNLVYVHSRGNACPRCMSFINKIYVDDVFSSSNKYNSNYPKLSSAISNGLYHPNCKDSHSTYYADVELPNDFSEEQINEANRIYNLQQMQRYNERNIRKYKRLEEGSLDKSNKDKYSILRKQWQSRQRKLINENNELRRDYFREKINYL